MSTTNNNSTPGTPNAPATQVERNVSDMVLNKIKLFQAGGDLVLPSDYVPENALKSAFLILQETKDKDNKPVLSVCTKESIASALMKMVVWGLSPLKSQCYFIAYGTELNCTPDYSGNIVLAKRYGDLKWIKANAIFEGDTFKFEVDTETGRRKLIEHNQTLESFGGEKLKGAYAIYELNDGTRDMEIMNMRQIQNAWAQGGSKGNSPAHNKFGDQMAIKTVINRACKLLIRGSNDATLIGDDEETRTDTATSSLNGAKQAEANGRTITLDDDDVKDVTPPKAQTEAQGEQKQSDESKGTPGQQTKIDAGF